MDAASTYRRGVFLPGETYTYYPYTTLRADLLRLQTQCPLSLRVRSIGKTALGRDIFLAQMGNPSAAHRVIIVGATHAREHITTRLIIAQIHALLNGLNTDAALAQRLYYTRIDFIPMHNPDGVTLSQQGLRCIPDAALQRTLYRLNDNHTDFTYWKANARGVDLNRNFDADFSRVDGPDAPAPEGFKGRAPGSEAETAALCAFIQREHHHALLSYHAQGEEIYWFFGQRGTDFTRDRQLAHRLSGLTGYQVVSPQDSGPSAGGLKDWFVQHFRRPGFTVEVGRNGSTFPIEDAQIPTILAQNEYTPRFLIEEAALS